MGDVASIESISGVIALAVAPVFLLAGIAGLLGVLSSRLGRITDRARVIERRIPAATDHEQEKLLSDEAASLWERTRLSNWAIRLFGLGALTVCLVIVTLFIGELSTLNIAVVVAVLFVAAMLFLISGLVLFLREVRIATARMRQGMETVLASGSDPTMSARGPKPESDHNS